MTEPQELRSIDEFFNNTFNNLPETPAESGWDTPSDSVWQKVRHNIGQPGPGWSLQSLVIVTAIAIMVALGLYFALFTPEKAETNPVVTTTTQVAAPIEKTENMPELKAPELVQAQEMAQDKSIQPESTPTVRQRRPAARINPVVNPANAASQKARNSGAAPLPGTSPVKKPNTTEELKAERAFQLEQRWKTPLNLLPVPRTKEANN